MVKEEEKLHLPTFVIFKRIMKTFLQYKKLMAMVIIIFLFVVSSRLIVPKLIGLAIDDFKAAINAQDYNFEIFLMWAGLILGVSLFGNAITFAAGVLRAILRMNVLTDLRAKLHWVVLKLNFTFHAKSSSGALIARETRDLNRIGGFFSEFIVPAMFMFLITTGCVILIFFADILIGFIVLGLELVVMAGVLYFAVGLRAIWKDCDDAYDNVTTCIQENVAGVRVVKAFAQSERQQNIFGTRIRLFVDKIFKGINQIALKISPSRSFFVVAIPTTLLIGGYKVVNNTMNLGELAAIIMYLRMMQDQFWGIGRLVDVFQNAIASADRVITVLDDDSYLKIAENPVEFNYQNVGIKFEGLNFRYNDDSLALKDINLEIEAGTTVGIIGRTGSGKSTLVQLLPRFYDPESGSIKLNGVDIKDLDIEELRRNISLVFQDTFLFSQTIAENIAFGKPDATMKEIIQAAKHVQADDFINELQEGYETVIGERGIMLSGGQKQRLSIARSIITKPKILIFDDATASVDAGTEQQLQDEINELSRDCTTIIISQRISSVMNADKIVILENGEITDTGTHSELISRPGVYNEIYKLQFAIQDAS